MSPSTSTVGQPPPSGGGAQDSTTPRSVHVALIFVQIWFASMSIVSKIVLREVPPRGVIVVRSTVGALVFLLIWAARGLERIAWHDHLRIAVYALFGIAANQLMFIEGLERSTATNVLVLGTSIPVFTVAVALVLGRERATAGKIAGLAVALAGALFVTGASRLSTGSTGMLTGNLLVLGNSLSFSIYLVIGRGILARYSASTVIAFTFLYGALMLLPIGAPVFVRVAPHLSRDAWIGLVYLVVFPSVGSYLLNAWALARVEASVVAVYIYIQPVLGALMAAAWLGERPTWSTLAGGALIFSGVWIVGADARRRARIAAA